MLLIDGSFGEGGGQILRSSLALAMVTQRPFRIENIRAGREKPGLMRQHLTAVQAAAVICGGHVEGDRIGSTALSFTPGAVNPGDYHFSIGTAGSTTLVLQAVLLPLLIADGPSRLTLEGGTHNPHAPPFDFLASAYLPLIDRMGPKVTATLEQAGFYPAGGGRIVVEIEPGGELRGFDLLERGAARSHRARALVANLPRHIAERELRVVGRKLNWPEESLEAVEIENSRGPGNIVSIEVACEHVTEVFTGFGEVGRPAEAVATRAVQAVSAVSQSDRAGRGVFDRSTHAAVRHRRRRRFCVNGFVAARGDAPATDRPVSFGRSRGRQAADRRRDRQIRRLQFAARGRDIARP
jgi:RNA 3'-terminal phosphate cyclase (ATP)